MNTLELSNDDKFQSFRKIVNIFKTRTLKIKEIQYLQATFSLFGIFSLAFKVKKIL